MMVCHRMSALGLAAICPLSPVLSGSHGASTEALKGKTFHGLCSGDRDAQVWLHSLPQQDQVEIRSWAPPATIHFRDRGETVTLDYHTAEKEVHVCLDKHGQSCSPDSQGLATEGHLDMAWVHQFADGTRVAYVGDIKKSSFTTVDGPDTLQCTAYGFAYASLMACDGFVCGLWIAEESAWRWSNKYHDLATLESMQLLDLVLHAAGNEGDPVFGVHCNDCHARLHCPEFLLPAALGESELGALAESRPGELTDDQALRALAFYTRSSPLLKRVYDTLKVYAERRGGVYDPESGKVWRAVKCQGREGVSVARLRERLGEKAEQFISRGASYNQMKWCKQ